MKVSREQAEKNRELILETAGSLFRQHGFDGIGIADLMNSAGFTVGGFYKNFDSKEDLIAQTCNRINKNVLAKWQTHIADSSIEDPYKRIGSGYLSIKNRDNLSNTCIYTTLAAEVPRHESPVREVFKEGVAETLKLLAELMPGESAETKQKLAIQTFSQWIGAMILARATSDSELSEVILKTVRESTKVD